MISSLMWYLPQEIDAASNMLYSRVDDTPVEYCDVGGKAILSRVLSTDPSHYLSGKLSPGADISHLVNRK
ncbi:MAG: hypothetical protein IJP17_01340 [Clostridia bacterium]|nr:hypothetical protein [Clostridia bacterium]